MIAVAEAFATSYAKARVKFLEAAAMAGLTIESQAHPLPGRDGEVLAMDVVRDGPVNADKLLKWVNSLPGSPRTTSPPAKPSPCRLTKTPTEPGAT